MKKILENGLVFLLLASGPLAIGGKIYDANQWARQTAHAVSVWKLKSSAVINLQYALFDTNDDKKVDMILEYRASAYSPRGGIPSTTCKYTKNSPKFESILGEINNHELIRLK